MLAANYQVASGKGSLLEAYITGEEPARHFARDKMSSTSRPRADEPFSSGAEPSRTAAPLALSGQLDFLWPADCHGEVSDQTVDERIDPAVNREVLSARPGPLHDDVRRDVSYLPDDV
jgi:hypothetical protein